MAAQVNFLDQIVAGKVNWRLKVRVINMWTVPNRNNTGEVNTLELIVIDAKCSRIHAVIKRQWFSKFFHQLEMGGAYIIEKVLVAQNDNTFKKTNHKYKLNFMGCTTLTSVKAEEIPMTLFDFMDFPTLLRQTRTDIFADVIGHVIEKSSLQQKSIQGRNTLLIEITLEDLAKNKLRCSLWGNYAEQIQEEFELQSPCEPFIVVLQMCKLTKYQGVMGISTAFYGSILHINEDTIQFNDYKSRMELIPETLTQVTQTPTTPRLSVAEELLGIPRMTIAELIEATNQCMGTVLVRVIEIDHEQGFAFNSCNTCYGAASKDGSKFWCGHCDSVVTATPRYKLQVNGIDETGSTTFVLFNQLVSSYVGKSAVDLLRTYQKRPSSSDGPEELNCIIGKQFLFKVAVTDMNIHRGFQTFTVKKLSDELCVIEEFMKKHGIPGINEEDEAVFMNAYTGEEGTIPVVDLSKKRTFPVARLDFNEDTDNEQIDQVSLSETQVTPPDCKAKRPVADIETIDLNEMDFSPESAAKMMKICVKIEPKE